MKKEKRKRKNKEISLSLLSVCLWDCGYRLEKPEIIHETYFACGS
jgi:hypothetical protein